MTTENTLIVQAFWDEEAGVWVATSDDVAGLATEADNINSLVAKLKVMIPELLDANGYPDRDEIPFQLNTQLTAVAYRHVA